jgi:hypothetical protein
MGELSIDGLLYRSTIKHSVKEKVYYWLNERKDDEMLPMITAYISAIDYAVDRKVNSFHAFTADCSDVDGMYLENHPFHNIYIHVHIT